MNNYKRLSEVIKELRDELNSLYKNQDHDYVKKGLEICGFKGNSSEKIAVLRRIVDLKTDPLMIELNKKGYDNNKILEIRDKMYDFTALIHENMHRNLIAKINEEKIVSKFDAKLLTGIHKAGLILNKLQKKWQKRVVDENCEIFSRMKDPYEFILKNALFQKTSHGEICERCYGVVKFGEFDESKGEYKSAILEPYAIAFKDEITALVNELVMLENELKPLAISKSEIAYVEYFRALKDAFLESDNDNVIKKWRDAEMAWMNVKSPIQVGHPLEYYEDAYTHAVALEWDIRLKSEDSFDEQKFKKNIKKSFDKVYKNINAKNQIMHSLVNSNIDKTQLYIGVPVIYYGANLEGLFSAQVVPNDEFVSSNSGKKIFAFADHIYESAKSKPKMRLTSEIFDKDYLDFGRDILENRAEIWHQVYAISTIGHEFGHLLFIDEDTESIMNRGGVFKFIEEFKATTGGLVNFFYNENESLKLAIFDDLIRRSVGLVAWMEVDSVRAYYCEGLMHLTLLFKSGVLEFDGAKLKVNFSLESYENFKEICIKTYESLAKIYENKLDASVFLEGFCHKFNSTYLPNHDKTKEFVEFYHARYKEIGNESIDE